MRKLNKTVEMFWQNISNKNRKSGFTLVELIIVITILAILATIAFISFRSYISDARDANRISTITNIEKGLELFTIKTWTYPEPDSATTYTWWTNSSIKQWVIWENVVRNISMNAIPLDPKDKTNYVYSVFWNNSYYQVATEKENLSASIINTVYADSKSAIVKWNYKIDPSLPSLIVVPSSVTGSWIFDPKVCFVVDGWKNTLNNCVEKKEDMKLKDFDSSLVWYWDMESWTWNILYDLSGNENNGNKGGTVLPFSTWWIIWKWHYFALSGSVIIPTFNTGSYTNVLKNWYTISAIVSREVWNSIQWRIIGWFAAPLLMWDNNTWTYWNIQITQYNSWWTYDKAAITWMNYTNKFSIIHWSYNGNKIILYVNWKMVREENTTLPIIPASSLSLVTIGNYNDSKTYWFKWIIDDIKIYNRALSDEEIAQQARIAGF